MFVAHGKSHNLAVDVAWCKAFLQANSIEDLPKGRYVTVAMDQTLFLLSMESGLYVVDISETHTFTEEYIKSRLPSAMAELFRGGKMASSEGKSQNKRPHQDEDEIVPRKKIAYIPIEIVPMDTIDESVSQTMGNIDTAWIAQYIRAYLKGDDLRNFRRVNRRRCADRVGWDTAIAIDNHLRYRMDTSMSNSKWIHLRDHKDCVLQGLPSCR